MSRDRQLSTYFQLCSPEIWRCLYFSSINKDERVSKQSNFWYLIVFHPFFTRKIYAKVLESASLRFHTNETIISPASNVQLSSFMIPLFARFRHFTAVTFEGFGISHHNCINATLNLKDSCRKFHHLLLILLHSTCMKDILSAA